MKIATWNVNSLRARIDRVAQWLDEQQPDVVMFQETKCKDDNFPSDVFEARGYVCAHYGRSQWNGVAICSRIGLSEIRCGFLEEDPQLAECRVISASCGGVRLYCVYVPNGRVVNSEFYVAKLEWLTRLREDLQATCSVEDFVGVFGDFNVAPCDRDVWDVERLEGSTHITHAERSKVEALCDWGLVDAVRSMHPDEEGLFSWWDYRGGAFHRGWGMRIDLVLLSKPLMQHLVSATIDREARKGRQPSDHAPVVIVCEPLVDLGGSR